MTIYDILDNAGLGRFRLWSEKSTPFLIRLKDGKPTGDLYFYLIDPDDEYKPNMFRVKDGKVTEFYEVYKNPSYFREKDFREFGLDISDYDMHQYSLRRILPGREKAELYIDERDGEFFTRIDKDGNRQFYRTVLRSDGDGEFTDIFGRYAVNSIVAYYDRDRKFTGICTITVSSDLGCYQEYKDGLDIGFTF